MENLLSFFEDAAEPFWIIDESCRLIYGNKSFYIFFESTYQSIIKKGDDVLYCMNKESEHYLFWKNSYDKAFQFKKYTTESNKRDQYYKNKVKFDFRLVEVFSKFLCIRAFISNDKEELFSEHLLPKISESSEFTLSIDEDGNVLRISPAVQNILGYFTDWMENKSVIDFLHPDEKDLLTSFFKNNESLETTWCRIRDVNNNYLWCKIQMAAFGKLSVDRKYVITINEIRIQKTSANSFVPDADILQVISEAQGNYIKTATPKKAIEICLTFFQNEGIAPFSFVAELEWKGTYPALKIVAQVGSWLYAQENSMQRLLNYLEETCLNIQQDINQRNEVALYNAFPFTIDSTGFLLYILVEKGEIMGVLVTSELLINNTTPQVSVVISYFRQLFTSILSNSKFIRNANNDAYKLALSKDELQSLVTSLDDIILEVNAQLDLVNIWCNDETMLSMPKELMKGKRITAIKGIEIGNILEKAIKKVLITETTQSVEYLDSMGNVNNWFLAKMNLVKMFNGEKRVSILIQDITARKEAELLIQQTLNKEKELHEMKSKMITSVSHEFRTPLSTIVSSTELLEMQLKKSNKELFEQSEEIFENIYEEVERLSDMMRNFLVMGRFEENQMPFRPKQTDIVALTKRIIRTRFQTKFGAEKIQLKLYNTPKEAWIDPSLFWHIVSNLLSNGIKYSPVDCEVLVEINFLQNEFQLIITDKGIGIPEKDMPNIFQAFYRADNSDQHNGYGLGLAIVDKFVKMHNGNIEVKSEEGKGSTFITHFKYIQYEKNQTTTD